MLGLSACGATDEADPVNKYQQVNLAATSSKYGAKFVIPDMVDAWGIAIRPTGAGGHFWVTGGGTSWQFVGDVKASPTASLQTLFQDGLRAVTIPGADSVTTEASIGKSTGVVYNGADINSSLFRVTAQTAISTGETVEFDGSARFIFVTDSGRVSAWTDRTKSGATVRVDGASQSVFDGAEQDMAFFGVAIKPTWDQLWLADFGAHPQVRTLDAQWNLIPTAGFVNPFATGALRDAANPALGKTPVPGDPVPFNIQVIEARVFVAYCISQPDENDATAFFAAEEDALDADKEVASLFKPNKGKLVEYSLLGAQVRIYEDDGRLNAPWGVTIAPSNFGKLSNALLVGNFGGNGTIAAYDLGSGKYIDFVRDEKDGIVKIPGLWALLFGNGDSLGDSNALYFAAGPEDEVDGLFGSLRYAI